MRDNRGVANWLRADAKTRLRQTGGKCCQNSRQTEEEAGEGNAGVLARTC